RADAQRARGGARPHARACDPRRVDRARSRARRPRRTAARPAVTRLVVVVSAALLVLPGCGGDKADWRLTADAGVRIRNVVSAEAMRRPDGSILVWANRPEGIAAYRSRDGLTFRPAAGRMPL